MNKFPMLSVLAVAACALTLAGPAQAQSKKDLAAKVIQLQTSLTENVGGGLADQVAQQVLQTAGRAMSNVPTDKREAVGKDIQAEVKRFHTELSGFLRDRATKLAPTVIGPALEEKFSEEELKQLVAWLESPVSKKFQQTENDMQSALAQKLVEDTRPTVEPKLRVLEQALQKKLSNGAPGAAGASAPAASAAAAKPAAAPKKK
jgi:uncharacterized protein